MFYLIIYILITIKRKQHKFVNCNQLFEDNINFHSFLELK